MSLMSVPVFIMVRGWRQSGGGTEPALRPLSARGVWPGKRLVYPPPHTARGQEPTSVLQKMAEIMEYSELLDKAAQCEVSTWGGLMQEGRLS